MAEVLKIRTVLRWKQRHHPWCNSRPEECLAVRRAGIPSTGASPAPMQIRPAEPRDAEVISDIYNQGIEDRIATLETRLRTQEERRTWLETRGPRHPVVVCERNGVVCGWASLNSFNPRDAYDYVADFSVYVERESRGQGVGGALLARLEVLAANQGYHKLVLAMLPSNDAGITLYQRRGFREVGTYREHGRVDGHWVDILIMEKILT